MDSTSHRPSWKTLLAFAIIYLVWGSTYLAISIGVREVPPFLLAAIRFSTAGLLLFLWSLARGESSPTARQWKSISLIAILIFVVDYGLLFWAEQRVPSGMAAVVTAIIPALMTISEIIFLKTQKLTIRLAASLLIGFAGVAVLMSRTVPISPSLNLAHTKIDAPIDALGAIALIIASVGWAIASSLLRKLPLPASKVVSSASQMLAGGFFLFITAAALGEFRNFHPANVSREAWLSLLYLIIFGSIIAFTAYVWLIHHESPTKVSTYAYVNPVVAVLLGYFLAHEPLGLRTILGSALILASVIVITTTPKPSPPAT
jgi:drug/metabolite transporter (DMT)-like permease